MPEGQKNPVSILPRRLAVLIGLAGCLAMAAWGQTPRFERDVLPILTANCLSCHGGTSMAGLDLRTARSALKGSHNGPVIVKEDPENSLLYQRVSKREMPPPAFKQTLGDAEIETIRRWIEGGALSDVTALVAVASSEELARFEREILPIFRSRCVACHAGGQPMGGLDLETLESLLKGSTNGPVILQGWSDKSILIRKVSSRAMPPPGAGEPAFPNPRMILKQVWVGKGTEVGSEFLSRGFRCGDGEGGGGLRGRGKLCRVVLRTRKLVELPPPPPIPEESRADRPVSGRCLTTVTGSPPAVFSCVAASAARTRCRSSGVLVAREKRP